MSFRNLFSAMLGTQAPDQPTELSEVAVTAKRRPGMESSMPQKEQPVEYNYNNQGAAQAVQDSVKALPKGNSGNPGIWGLLPERMQHGTLRNVVGALGDAFLVQSGNKPTYAPRLERERMGAAYSGYNPEDPASMQAAIQRVAGTGATGAMDFAETMQRNTNDNLTRRENAKLMAEGRATQQESNDLYRSEQTSNREVQTLQRFNPIFDGMRASARTPEAYARAYAQADQMAKRANKDFTAEDAGFISPEHWSPETYLSGMTSNQVAGREDRAAQRDVSIGNSIRSAATSRSNNAANNRTRQAEISSSEELTRLQQKQDRGETLTPAEEQRWQKGITLPSGRTPRGGRGAKTGGPTNGDVTYLRNNPKVRAQFEARFGPGSAAKYLGK